MAADYFTTTLAPFCFGLLSERSKERANSLAQLKNILPEDVKKGRITAQDVEKMLHSFCDWVEYEYRVFRKEPNCPEKFQSTLKELKWLLYLVSSYLADVKIQSLSVVFDLLLKILSNTPLSLIPESVVILNGCLLSKASILHRLSERTKYIEKLITTASIQMRDADATCFHECLKLTCLAALVIPFNTEFDSELYKYTFETFLQYLKHFELSRSEPQLLSLLFGTVNALLLSNYDLIDKYHSQLSKFGLMWARTRNSAVLQKLLNFFLIKQPTASEKPLLESFLLAELNDPLCVVLHSGHPMRFLDVMQQYKSGHLEYLSAADLLKCSFIDLCCSLPLQIEFIPPALALCEPFCNTAGLKLATNDPSKSNNFREWLAFTASYFSSTEAAQLDSSPSTWCRLDLNKTTDFEAVDSFLLRLFSGTASASTLDPFVLKRISCYFTTRFKDLWWSTTAETFAEQFSGWIQRTFSDNSSIMSGLFNNLEWLIAFSSCLLCFTEPAQSGMLQSFNSDCQQFFKSLQELTSFAHLPPSSTYCEFVFPDNIVSIFKNLLTNLNAIASESRQSFASISVLSALLDRRLPEFNVQQSDFFISFQLFYKVVYCLPPLITKLHITEFLSSWIPLVSAISECHSSSFEKENANSFDPFASIKSSSADEITSNSVHMVRLNRKSLTDYETNLFNAVKVSYSLISAYSKIVDSDALLIVNDWKIFIDELLLSPILKNVRLNLTPIDSNILFYDLREFLDEKSFGSFCKVRRWTPFAVAVSLGKLSFEHLERLLEEWIACKNGLLEFPLLDGLRDFELIKPEIMVRALLDSDMTHVFNYFFPRDRLMNYFHCNFAQIYAFSLLLTQSSEPGRQASGRKLVEELFPFFFDHVKVLNFLRSNVIEVIAQIIVLGSTDWANAVDALKYFAEKLKVSTASDFSELIHPIHAVSIIPIVAKNSKSCAPVIKLFQQVPLLHKYPQLLFLAYNHVPSDQKELFSQYADSLVRTWKLSDDKIPTAQLRSYSFHEFILRYCDYVVWRSHPEAASKILYFMLNIVNRSNKKVRELNSFTFLEEGILGRLRLFDVQPSARIFLSTPKLDDDLFDSTGRTNYNFADLITSLLWIVKSSAPSPTTEIVEVLNCSELAKVDSVFGKVLLTFLFKLSSIESGKKLIVQKLISTLDSSPKGIYSYIWFDIIEAFPIRNGVIGDILQFLPSDSVLLKHLIEQCMSNENFPSALYLYNLFLEQPRNRDSLDLELLERIHSRFDVQDDYLNVIKKRLRQFDSSLPQAWDCTGPLVKVSEPPGIFGLFKESLFINRDVTGILSGHERKFATWVFNLQHGYPESTEWSSSNYANLLECVSRNRRTVSSESIKLVQETLQEPSKLNFNVASILPHISPKFEQIAKFIKADITSRALWGQDQELAIDTAKYALSCFPHNFPDELRALLLCRIGEWNGQCKAERPSHIISNYLDKAMRIVEEKSNTFNPSNLAHVHLTVARFIDEQYGQVTKMDELSRRSQLVAETRASLESCRANLNRLSASITSEERMALERNVYELNQQYQADQEEYSKRLKDRNTFLLKALANYISALSYGCKSETEQISAISRICALWFQHHQEITANEIINSSIPGQSSKSTLSAGIKTVPVRYYLPLIYQLAARATYNPIEPPPNEFQKVLLRLLVQMLLSHPFDCIYQLLALRAGSQNERVFSQAKRRRLVEAVTLNRDAEAEGRAAAAALIIDQVKKISPQLATIIASIEQLCDAYIELAKYNFSDSESKTMLQQANPFPTGLAIKKLLYPLPPDSPFKDIPIATCTSETVYFAGFVDKFRALRGINLPKLVEVISTTGTPHQQLVKGNDDVRQDAVMEQVFHRVNQLLKSDHETRSRNLSMRTYRVIPLRPLVGLIEFVSNSITFSDYLKGAHERLRPSDLKPDECRLKLQAEFERAGATVRSKMNVLVNEIGTRFKPVLRHFFFEHFQISDWWTARQAYIRSMATASVLGWIVGLGDRHGMNILLDKKTGEVVHIDLNMIFEAGKTLRIPERVPFRMTPDCVDAMGPEQLGLDGPFKQNAISVLKLLRKERNALMMVLDVFKYDPLQKWTGMAAAAHQETNDLSCSVNTSSSTTFVTKAAERALQRIREKLEGREEGSILSESGHVSYLIHTASDPEMLCQMFYGWQAYF